MHDPIPGGLMPRHVADWSEETVCKMLCEDGSYYALTEEEGLRLEALWKNPAAPRVLEFETCCGYRVLCLTADVRGFLYSTQENRQAAGKFWRDMKGVEGFGDMEE